jgi:hypothetical protein
MENLTNPILALIDAELMAEEARDSAPIIVNKQEFANKLAIRFKVYLESITEETIHSFDDYNRGPNEQQKMAENDVKTFIDNNPL